MPAVKFARFAAEVLEVYDHKAPATRAKMKQALREVGELGVRTTADLKPVTIARWLAARPARSPATARSLLSTFRAACSLAVASGYCRASPFAYRNQWVEVPEPEGRRHLTRAEIGAILDLLEREAAGGGWKEHRLYALVSTLAYTGLRRGEALGLHVGDVDQAERIIRLQARRRLKTRASAAPVPMPGPLAEVLAGWLPRAASVYAFPVKSGKSPWTGGPPGEKPLDQVRAAGERAGVKGVNCQLFRHSWATHAESAWGLGELTVQRVLRHTSPRTQTHYRHADLVNLREAVATISFGEGRSRVG